MSIAKLLIADDVNMFLEIAKGILKHSKVHILTAKDGAEALEIARRERPALVVLDLHMPRMNGAECCAAIKADPLLRGTPVVMMTSAGKEEDRQLCLKAGCDEFIGKPLDRCDFLAKAKLFVPNIDRREVRVPIRSSVRFKIHGVSLQGDVLDIGENGVYIAADYEVEVNSTVEFTFTLTDRRGTQVTAKGRVAWVNSRKKRTKTNMPEGFGVEFQEIDRNQSSAVRFYVAAEAAKMEE